MAKLYLDQTKPGWRNEVSATYQRLQASTGPHFNTESEKDIEAAIVDAVASCNITWEIFSCASVYVSMIVLGIFINGVALLIGSILSTVNSAFLIHGARKVFPISWPPVLFTYFGAPLLVKIFLGKNGQNEPENPQNWNMAKIAPKSDKFTK